MGHRWEIEETHQENPAGAVAQSLRLKKSGAGGKKQKMRLRKHKWKELRLKMKSLSFAVFLFATIDSPGLMGHRYSIA